MLRTACRSRNFVLCLEVPVGPTNATKVRLEVGVEFSEVVPDPENSRPFSGAKNLSKTRGEPSTLRQVLVEPVPTVGWLTRPGVSERGGTRCSAHFHAGPLHLTSIGAPSIPAMNRLSTPGTIAQSARASDRPQLRAGALGTLQPVEDERDAG